MKYYKHGIQKRNEKRHLFLMELLFLKNMKTPLCLTKYKIIFFLFTLTSMAIAEEWHYPLYLDGGQPAKFRSEVLVTNNSEKEIDGKILYIPAYQLGLQGIYKRELRIVSKNGNELLFCLKPNSKMIDNNTKVGIPIYCPAKSNSKLWAYFGNPSASEVPDELTHSNNQAQGISYIVNPKEALKLNRQPVSWDMDRNEFPLRLCVSFFNLSEKPVQNVLGVVPINRLTAGNFRDIDYALFYNGEKIPFLRGGENIIFEIANISPKSERVYTIYLRKERKNKLVNDARVEITSEILSNQKYKTKLNINRNLFGKLVNSKINLLKNPVFETNKWWIFTSEGAPCSPKLGKIIKGGIFNRNKAILQLPKGTTRWTGFKQKINLLPKSNYIVMGWGRRISGACTQMSLHHYSNSTPSDKQFLDSPIAFGNKVWNSTAINIQNRHMDGALEVHLTNNQPCVAEFDGLLVARCINMGAVKYESFTDFIDTQIVNVWQVNTTVKVFPFFNPPKQINIPEISLARNEKENLQLAIRSNKTFKRIIVTAASPVLSNGTALDAPEIKVVGNVIVDAKSAYYSFDNYKLNERCIPPLSLKQLYPDPLLPSDEFKLFSGKTKAIYLCFNAKKNNKPGVYRGVVELHGDSKLIESIPYKVTVRNFVLPNNPSLSAIFDKRTSAHFADDSIRSYRISRLAMENFLATKRVSIDQPSKFKIKYNKDRLDVNFASFDASSEIILKKYNVPLQYIPESGLFNFRHPPRSIWGINPYSGKYPFRKENPSHLNPEYKQIMRKKWGLIWSHIKKNNWQDRFLFYLSDEPDFRDPHIVKQLAALCDMIHEVSPNIKIYSSTWKYIPEWENKIDVWGIGVQSLADIKNIKKNGSTFLFTTDGQFCIDTPYNALERMMPLYCYIYGALGYEFWGADWYTRNPFIWGSHKDRISNIKPGVYKRNRFPNGDGYFVYPGALLGYSKNKVISSIRLETIRDGLEDYEYYIMLDKMARNVKDKAALATLEKIKTLVPIPNSGGRQSAELLPDPDLLTVEYRNKIAQHIERLNDTEPIKPINFIKTSTKGAAKKMKTRKLLSLLGIVAISTMTNINASEVKPGKLIKKIKQPLASKSCIFVQGNPDAIMTPDKAKKPKVTIGKNGNFCVNTGLKSKEVPKLRFPVKIKEGEELVIKLNKLLTSEHGDNWVATMIGVDNEFQDYAAILRPKEIYFAERLPKWYPLGGKTKFKDYPVILQIRRLDGFLIFIVNGSQRFSYKETKGAINNPYIYIMSKKLKDWSILNIGSCELHKVNRKK